MARSEFFTITSLCNYVAKVLEEVVHCSQQQFSQVACIFGGLFIDYLNCFESFGEKAQ